MIAYGPDRAECLVFTYKEGLLSSIAHDLKLRVTQFSVEIADDGSTVEARFDPRSLRVVSAMKSGAESPSSLSARDKRTIEATLVDEVLEARRHGEIRFVSSSVTRQESRAQIAGTLSLHGRSRPLTVEATRTGDRWHARVALHQPDFGIKPYSAMLGALRVKAELTVEISLPA